VSQVTSDKVLTATFELYPATVDEIANYEEVGVCREQTRKVLEELRDHEILAREKDTMQAGNPYVYYPTFEEELSNI
jgi:predicted transcriptional regulator